MKCLTVTEPRNSVAQFARMMEEALKRNEEKGGWADCNDEYLCRRLIEETQDLLMALKAGAGDGEVLRECYDVANFAMMIADNRGMPSVKVTTDKE